MKTRTKKILCGVLVSVVAFVTVGAVLFHNSLQGVMANESFFGMQTIIDENDPENPFRILEIVPDKRLAKFGYYIDGQEPMYYDAPNNAVTSWKEALTLVAKNSGAMENGASVRAIMMSALKANLSPILDASADKAPLAYTDYQESYVPKDGWQRFTFCFAETGEEYNIAELTPLTLEAFPGVEKLAKGTDAYVMNAAAGGSYQQITADDGTVYYVYVGAGKGGYELAENSTSGKSLDADVYLTGAYYTGGFTNHNWLQNHVFNQDGKLDKDLVFSVTVCTPDELKDVAYAGMDLVVFTDSSVFAGAYENAAPACKDYYRTSDEDFYDFTWAQTVSMMAAMENGVNSVPVVLDSKLLGDAYKNTYAGYLAKVLASEASVENVAIINQMMTLDLDSDDDDRWLFDGLLRNLTMVTDADNHYVRENVYVIPSDDETKPNTFFGKDFSADLLGSTYSTDDAAYITEASSIGFGEVAKLIQDENFFRKIESEAGNTAAASYFDSTISKAINLEYIITFRSNGGASDTSRNYKVLNISPCSLKNSTKKNIEKKIAHMLGSDGYNLEVVHMASMEFVGKIEDLCQYDMIYMDLETDTFYHNKKTGRTTFNDSDMNGLVYTNVGDRETFRWEGMKGMLDTDYGNKSNRTDGVRGGYDYRYSGNDITEDKVNKIIKYAKSGAPIVIADNFLTEASGKTVVNDFIGGDKKQTGYIDNCSYMYELIDEIKGYGNVFTESKVVVEGTDKEDNIVYSDGSNMSLFRRYLAIGKTQLNLSAIANEEGFNYSKADGRTLKWDFTITNRGAAGIGSSFDCKLFLDVNADGKFSENEAVDVTDLRITNGNKYQNPNKQSAFELQAGLKYHMEYDVTDDYIGLIPWKVEVRQNNNAYRYDVEEGFYYRPNNRKTPDGKTDRVPVKVLQLYGGKLDGTPFGSAEGSKTTLIMERAMNDPDSAFGHYARTLEDFDLQIKSISTYQFWDIWRKDKSNNILFDYDMLVIGFADCFIFYQPGEIGHDMNPAYTDSYQWIVDYINAGKSVLYTHDTTTWTDNQENAGWGYSFGVYMAQYVGLDRYGVRSNKLLQAGIDGLTKDDGTVVATSWDNAYHSLTQLNGNGTNYSYTSGQMYNEIVDYAKKNGYDVAYKPNSNKKVLVSAVQARNTANLDGQLKDDKRASTNRVNEDNKYWMDDASNTARQTDTTSARIVNSGQILEYPYNIWSFADKDGRIPIASTHAQYYQINMSKDDDQNGESDVVVWMTLASTQNDAMSQYYDFTRNDVRNNYYIYTIGNVTYSGVGHTDVDYKINGGGNGTEAEVKLYINTMIAAFRATLHAPTVSLKKSSDANANDLYTVYVGADVQLGATGSVENWTELDIGTKPDERIYFQIADGNLVRSLNKTTTVEFYKMKKDPSKNEYDPNYSGNIKLDVLKLRDEDGNLYNGKVKSGMCYSVDVPYDFLEENEDYAVFMVKVTTNIYGTNANGQTIAPMEFVGYNTCKFQRVGLFDLD